MPTRKKRGKSPPGKQALTKAQKKTKFLEVYVANGGNIRAAAQAVRIDRISHYDWLREDAEYAEKFARANTEANDLLDQEIFRRGHDGVLTPVWYQGKECGRIREYSDTLLIFFAKGRMPEKYRDNYKAEIDLKANVQASYSIDLTTATDEHLDRILEAAAGGSDGAGGNTGEGTAEAIQISPHVSNNGNVP